MNLRAVGVAFAQGVASLVGRRPDKNWPGWKRKLWFGTTGVACGTLSGFPPCCVAFYYAYWLPANCPSGYMRWAKSRYRERGQEVPYYIPCPRCVERGRRVDTRQCRPWCVRHGAQPINTTEKE